MNQSIKLLFENHIFAIFDVYQVVSEVWNHVFALFDMYDVVSEVWNQRLEPPLEIQFPSLSHSHVFIVTISSQLSFLQRFTPG